MQYAWHVSQYGDINVIDAVYDVSSYGNSPSRRNGSIGGFIVNQVGIADGNANVVISYGV